jgi:hypothetical protein
MNESTPSRGATWLAALTNTADVLAGDLFADPV